jgi:hypothetical protein
MKHDEIFPPETIDEQIEHSLTTSQQGLLPPEVKVMQRLSSLYEADMQSTARVQKRLVHYLVERNTAAQRVVGSITARSEMPQGEHNALRSIPYSPRKAGVSRFLLVASLLLIALLVGSMLTILRLAHGSQTGGKPNVPASPFLPGSYDSVHSRLFSNASPWNVPIGNNVRLDPNSSAMVSKLSVCCHVPDLFQYGMPIYTSTASDPTYTVQDPGNDALFTREQPIHIPNAAAPSPGSDHWMFIYDKTKNLIFEMWLTHKSGNTWSTNAGNVYSPTGDGVLQADGSSQHDNGASYFGGVVTDADIQRGFINHALSIAVGDTAATWRYPMHASDGHGTDAGAVPLGARLQLDPSINCKTLPDASAGEKMVCQALETYGGYVRDSGSSTLGIYFEGEALNDPARNPPAGSPGNPGSSGGIFNKVGLQDSKNLSAIPWGQLRVLSSWNSFTALKTPPTSVHQALYPSQAIQSSGIILANNALDLPYGTRRTKDV